MYCTILYIYVLGISAHWLRGILCLRDHLSCIVAAGAAALFVEKKKWISSAHTRIRTRTHTRIHTNKPTTIIYHSGRDKNLSYRMHTRKSPKRLYRIACKGHNNVIHCRKSDSNKYLMRCPNICIYRK